MPVKAHKMLCVTDIGANIHKLRSRQVTEQQESWNEQRCKTEDQIIQNPKTAKNARKKKAKKNKQTEKRLAEHRE